MEQFKEYIHRDGRTFHALARAAKVDESGLSRFMSGDRGLSNKAIDRLALELGLSVTHLHSPISRKGT